MSRAWLIRVIACTSLCATLGAACAAPPQKPSAPTTRERLSEALRAVRSPLQLRYNPAACDCPPFELRVGERWVRAAWPGIREPRWQALAERLGASTLAAWPIPLRVRGKVDGPLRRTRAGLYVVTVEVEALLGPPNT